MRLRFFPRPAIVRATVYAARRAKNPKKQPLRPAAEWLLSSLGLMEAFERAPMTPQDFEVTCAALIREGGLSAQVIGASGDQGADIIATGRGLRIVVQCKFYTRPVGNRAVQEAHAARGYHGATHAVVVTNAGYTDAAHALAKRLDVRLMAPRDLYRLGDLS